VIEKWRRWPNLALLLGMMATGLLVAQDQGQAGNQAPAPAAGSYQPKFAGDPARSDSEATALGYMRVVLRAEHAYKKRHEKYTTSLAALAGTGTFSKRMAMTTDRGDYTVGFRPHKARNSDEEGFVLTMTPKHLDATHRSFYAEEDGAIHADEAKNADVDSPTLR
jgi:hypothetical protein